MPQRQIVPNIEDLLVSMLPLRSGSGGENLQQLFRPALVGGCAILEDDCSGCGRRTTPAPICRVLVERLAENLQIQNTWRRMRPSGRCDPPRLWRLLLWSRHSRNPQRAVHSRIVKTGSQKMILSGLGRANVTIFSLWPQPPRLLYVRAHLRAVVHLLTNFPLAGESLRSSLVFSWMH